VLVAAGSPPPPLHAARAPIVIVAAVAAKQRLAVVEFRMVFLSEAFRVVRDGVRVDG